MPYRVKAGRFPKKGVFMPQRSAQPEDSSQELEVPVCRDEGLCLMELGWSCGQVHHLSTVLSGVRTLGS